MRGIPLAEAEIPQQRPPVRVELEAPRVLSTSRSAAGLSEIIATTYGTSTEIEAGGILRRYGGGGMLGILRRTLSLYARTLACRGFVKEVRGGGVTPEDLDEYARYGA